MSVDRVLRDAEDEREAERGEEDVAALVARILPGVVERRGSAAPAGVGDDDRDAEREQLEQQQQETS